MLSASQARSRYTQLAGLGLAVGHGHLRQQVFQQPAAIFEQGGAQGRFDPFGANRLPSLQPLLEELQEGFGFLVAFGLEFLEFFLPSLASDARVLATVRSTNSSASA